MDAKSVDPSSLHYYRYIYPVQKTLAEMALRRRTRRPSRRPMRRMLRRRRAPRKYRLRRNANRPYSKLLRQPVPDRLFTSLRFCLTGYIDTPVNGMGVQSFQTGLWDPDATGLGHQPLWFDQYVNMYKTYRVYGLKYKLIMSHSNNETIEIVIRHSNTVPSLETDWRALAARRGSRNLSMRETGAPLYIKGYMSTYKPFGLTKGEFRNVDSFWAPMTANPNTMAYLGVFTANHSSTIVTRVFWTAYIDMLCEFRTREQITSS